MAKENPTEIGMLASALRHAEENFNGKFSDIKEDTVEIKGHLKELNGTVLKNQIKLIHHEEIIKNQNDKIEANNKNRFHIDWKLLLTVVTVTILSLTTVISGLYWLFSQLMPA